MSHDFSIGRADFTIDFWVRFNATGALQVLYDDRPSGLNTNQILIYVNSDNTVRFQNNNGPRITSTATVTTGIWYHIAVTRSGTSTRLFLNGTQEGSTYTDTTDYECGASRPIIGNDGASPGNNFLNGWIDEVRTRIGEAVWTSNFTPPAAPYSEVLLLHANGVDASTTITDSSPSPKTVTAVGNAQLDTAQKKFGTASLLFDGTGDNLTLDGSKDFAFGTGDFTIDFWLRFNSTAGQQNFIDFRTSTDLNSPAIYLASGNIHFADSAQRISGDDTFSTNTWYHVALTRFNGSTRLFVNGVQDGSTYVAATNYTINASKPLIGDGYPLDTPFNGWLDELRILKGKAAWTSNFAVPSHEYHMASVARERLLLHGDGVDGSTTITDSSYWARNVVAVGNAQVDTAQKKFGTASLYSTQSGDAFLISDTEDFDFGSSDFTIDCWLRPDATGVKHVIYDQRPFDLNSASYTISWFVETDNTLRFITDAGSIVGTTVLSADTWYHVALTRSGASVRMFVNGIQDGPTASVGVTASFTNGNSFVLIGSDRDGQVLNGWIDEFRIVVGTAHWTSNFIPWPSAYDAPANVLLLHANGADATRAFPDSNDIPRAHRVTVNGDTRIDTAQSKFGGASILFDGTGDYLTLDGSSDFAFGTGDFTVDMWLRLNATGIIQVLFTTGTDAGQLLLRVNGDNNLEYIVAGSQQILGGTALTIATWYHVAITRSGTSTKMFLNGTQEGGTYTDSTNYVTASNRPRIGLQTNDTNALNGWLDEIRVKRGEAVWTTTFTPPSAAYNPSDGHLLIHGDGPNANVLMIADVGTAAGKTDIIVNADAQVDTAQQKFGTASALFDGTGDYLNVA